MEAQKDKLQKGKKVKDATRSLETLNRVRKKWVIPQDGNKILEKVEVNSVRLPNVPKNAVSNKKKNDDENESRRERAEIVLSINDLSLSATDTPSSISSIFSVSSSTIYHKSISSTGIDSGELALDKNESEAMTMTTSTTSVNDKVGDEENLDEKEMIEDFEEDSLEKEIEEKVSNESSNSLVWKKIPNHVDIQKIEYPDISDVEEEVFITGNRKRWKQERAQEKENYTRRNPNSEANLIRFSHEALRKTNISSDVLLHSKESDTGLERKDKDSVPIIDRSLKPLKGKSLEETRCKEAGLILADFVSVPERQFITSKDETIACNISSSQCKNCKLIEMEGNVNECAKTLKAIANTKRSKLPVSKGNIFSNLLMRLRYWYSGRKRQRVESFNSLDNPTPLESGKNSSQILSHRDEPMSPEKLKKSSKKEKRSKDFSLSVRLRKSYEANIFRPQEYFA